MSASLKCSFGTAPSALSVTSTAQTFAGGMLAANITDCAPMANIAPFAMCNSMANPQVASATAAAMGALTPMPCVPVPAGTWMPGAPTVLISNMPALNNSSKLMCSYGGVIEVVMPGQMTVSVP